MFENRVLRRIFGPKREVVMGGWRKEIHIIFWLENLRGKDHFEDLGVDGKIM
jgi:hypothetical protein